MENDEIQFNVATQETSLSQTNSLETLWHIHTARDRDIDRELMGSNKL